MKFVNLVLVLVGFLILSGCTSAPLPPNQEAKTSEINPEDPKFANKALVSGFTGISNYGFLDLTRQCATGVLRFINAETSDETYLLYASLNYNIGNISFVSLDPGTYYVIEVICSRENITFDLRHDYNDQITRKLVPHFTVNKQEVVFLGLFEIFDKKSRINGKKIGAINIKPVEGILEQIREQNPLLADSLVVRLAEF